MNLYLIELENERRYYVVEDDGSKAWEKLKNWIIEKNITDPKIKWKKIINIASNWDDERIGIFS